MKTKINGDLQTWAKDGAREQAARIFRAFPDLLDEFRPKPRAVPAPVKKTDRRSSTAARKKQAAIMRARWAKLRAATRGTK